VEAAEPIHETAKYNDKVRLWRCAICNYDNDESMTACDICEVIRNPVPGSIKRVGGGGMRSFCFQFEQLSNCMYA